MSMLGWGNAVTILPRLLWWQYGTTKYLKEQYGSIHELSTGEYAFEVNQR